MFRKLDPSCDWDLVLDLDSGNPNETSEDGSGF